MSPREAAWFLEALVPHPGESALFRVEDNNKHSSPLYPPNADGSPRGNTFFERPLRSENRCRLRLETIVHQAATWRLHDEFGWPLTHLIVESPDIGEDGMRPVLTREALDVLVLAKSCRNIPSKLPPDIARSEMRTTVGVEVKADKKLLDGLIKKMRCCTGDSHHEHKKCLALDQFQPRLFLAVAAGEDWRLFDVERRGDRAFIGEQRHLNELRFEG